MNPIADPSRPEAVGTERQATRLVQRRYDRAAPRYDAMESLAERLGMGRWRRLLWSGVRGPAVLEIGVGTGKNMTYYPPGLRVVALDLSPGMLRRARDKAAGEAVNVDLMLMDAQHLAFKDNTFDNVVTACVFCSVPDPLLGLAEVNRVAKPGAGIFMLEHVRPANRVLGRLMDLMNPLAARMGGENVNRRTVQNVVHSGLVLEKVTTLWGIFKLIQATKGPVASAARREA